jgi:hypothetical protein
MLKPSRGSLCNRCELPVHVCVVRRSAAVFRELTGAASFLPADVCCFHILFLFSERRSGGADRRGRVLDVLSFSAVAAFVRIHVLCGPVLVACWNKTCVGCGEFSVPEKVHEEEARILVNCIDSKLNVWCTLTSHCSPRFLYAPLLRCRTLKS